MLVEHFFEFAFDYAWPLFMVLIFAVGWVTWEQDLVLRARHVEHCRAVDMQCELYRALATQPKHKRKRKASK